MLGSGGQAATSSTTLGLLSAASWLQMLLEKGSLVGAKDTEGREDEKGVKWGCGWLNPHKPGLTGPLLLEAWGVVPRSRFSGQSCLSRLAPMSHIDGKEPVLPTPQLLLALL